MYRLNEYVKSFFKIKLKIPKFLVTCILYIFFTLKCKIFQFVKLYLGVSYSTKQLITHVYTNFAYFMLEHAC